MARVSVWPGPGLRLACCLDFRFDAPLGLVTSDGMRSPRTDGTRTADLQGTGPAPSAAKRVGPLPTSAVVRLVRRSTNAHRLPDSKVGATRRNPRTAPETITAPRLRGGL
jgi:hypothetical protein